MKKILLLLVAAFSFAFVFAQKIIHDPNVEVRNVTGSFHAIEISGGIDLYLSSGDEAVAISAKDDEIKSHIKTEIQNGVLKIWYEGKGMHFNFGGGKAMKAYVSFKNLDRIVASGGSDVMVDGAINANDLSLHFSGGSDFRGKVNASNLNVEQSGGSDVHISGTATIIKVSASGGSDFKGYDMVSDNCSVSSSGGSDVEITVNKELTAEASGGSDVYWKGSGNVKNVKTSGAGSVSHKS